MNDSLTLAGISETSGYFRVSQLNLQDCYGYKPVRRRVFRCAKMKTLMSHRGTARDRNKRRAASSPEQDSTLPLPGVFETAPLAEEEPVAAPATSTAASREITHPPDACPACDSAEYKFILNARDRVLRTTSATFEIIECVNCHLLRTKSRPEPDREQNASMSRARPDKVNSSSIVLDTYRRFSLGDLAGFIVRATRECESARKVLQLGAGDGVLVRLLRERGVEVIEAEPDGDEPVAQPGGYAAIIVLGTLESHPHPDAQLGAAYDLLAPDGRLVVQAANFECWQLLAFGENWSELDVPRRIIALRPRDLEYLLDCCGFEIVRRKYFSLANNPASFATSLAPGLDPFARRARGLSESRWAALIKDLLYLGLAAAAIPFTLVEALCRAGSTLTVEARKKR
jgi:hypothetical protein